MTVLQALAHAPLTPYELRFLTGLDDEMLAEANALMWPARLIEGHREAWRITDLGLKARPWREATGGAI